MPAAPWPCREGNKAGGWHDVCADDLGDRARDEAAWLGGPPLREVMGVPGQEARNRSSHLYASIRVDEDRAQINVAVAARPLDEPGARQFAQLLAALADPTRLRILTALETVCVPVGAIVAATGLPQPTVSHHLRILRDRGLVVADRRGQQVFYCLADDGLVEAFRALRGFVPGGAR